MSLEIDGVPILTYGDFNELVKGLRGSTPSVAPLAAWYQHADVAPQNLHNHLDVTCRANLVDGEAGDAAEQIINNACERLEADFPDQVLVG